MIQVVSVIGALWNTILMSERDVHRSDRSYAADTIAPLANGGAKLRERRFEAGQFRAAFRALTRVLIFLRRSVANEALRNLIRRKVSIHALSSRLFSPNPTRTDWSARNRCVFTVPSFIPVTATISRMSMSSTNRSRKTVRWRSDKLAATFQMPATCSLAKVIASGDCCRSEIQLRSLRSTSERRLRFQNFRRLLAS